MRKFLRPHYVLQHNVLLARLFLRWSFDLKMFFYGVFIFGGYKERLEIDDAGIERAAFVWERSKQSGEWNFNLISFFIRMFRVVLIIQSVRVTSNRNWRFVCKLCVTKRCRLILRTCAMLLEKEKWKSENISIACRSTTLHIVNA